MVRSNDYKTVNGYFSENRDNVTYLVLFLFGKDVLLFGRGMFWGVNDATNGNVCINNPNEAGYLTCGVWQMIDDGVELKMPGKGMYHLIVKDITTFQIYDVVGENPLERFAIDAIKTARCECW